MKTIGLRGFGTALPERFTPLSALPRSSPAARLAAFGFEDAWIADDTAALSIRAAQAAPDDDAIAPEELPTYMKQNRFFSAATMAKLNRPISFGDRLLTLAVIALITFLAGSCIYFAHLQPGPTAEQWFLAAILFFPLGLGWLLGTNGILAGGWLIYGLCATFLLSSQTMKHLLLVAVIMATIICLNLHGCSEILKH
jgi:hypothetical protein